MRVEHLICTINIKSLSALQYKIAGLLHATNGCSPRPLWPLHYSTDCLKSRTCEIKTYTDSWRQLCLLCKGGKDRIYLHYTHIQPPRDPIPTHLYNQIPFLHSFIISPKSTHSPDQIKPPAIGQTLSHYPHPGVLIKSSMSWIYQYEPYLWTNYKNWDHNTYL